VHNVGIDLSTGKASGGRKSKRPGEGGGRVGANRHFGVRKSPNRLLKWGKERSPNWLGEF